MTALNVSQEAGQLGEVNVAAALAVPAQECVR